MNAFGFSGMSVYSRYTLILRLNTSVKPRFWLYYISASTYPLCLRLVFVYSLTPGEKFKERITVNRLQLGITRHSGWFAQKYKDCQYQTQPDLRTTGVKWSVDQLRRVLRCVWPVFSEAIRLYSSPKKSRNIVHQCLQCHLSYHNASGSLFQFKL